MCIGMCSKSVTHWQLLLLLAVINSDQKSAVSGPVLRRSSDFVSCTTQPLMGPEATSIRREYLGEELAHTASILRERHKPQ